MAGNDEIRFWVMTWGSKGEGLGTGIVEGGNQGRGGEDGKGGMERVLWLRKGNLMAKIKIAPCRPVDINLGLRSLLPIFSQRFRSPGLLS